MRASYLLLSALALCVACGSDDDDRDASVPAQDAGQDADSRSDAAPDLDAMPALDAYLPTDAVIATGDASVDAALAVDAEAGLDVDAGADDAQVDARITPPAVPAGWSTPSLIATMASGSFGSLQVEGNAAGDIVALWQQSDEAQIDSIWSARFRQSTGWSAPTQIEAHDTSAFILALQVDASGNAFALWHEYEGVVDRTWAARMDATSGWATPARVEGFGSNARGSAITMFADGSALVVGDVGEQNAQHFPWSNVYTPGTGWGTATMLDNVNAADAPSLSGDGSAHAQALWCAWNAAMTDSKLVAARYDRATGWSSSVDVPTANGLCVVPGVSTVGNDHFLALYHVWDGSYPVLWATPYRNGAWGSGQKLEDDDKRAMSIALPRFAVNGAGNALIIYATPAGVWGRPYANGSFGAASLSSTNTNGPIGVSLVDINGVGDTLLTWSETNTAPNPLRARTRSGAAAWRDFSLPAPYASGTFHTLLDDQAHVTAVWNTFEGRAPVLWASQAQLPR